ncbi:11383_t:CDS:10 [Diversispora eburnea]|uniref:11383_t:CDS:1 n=1 Tax=Diversispora eburnea TaxID=1213867 RepID=A0A9N9AIB0_9GLOM|nr:11383_t:CDS:10 [Diversispora eburnea]
MNCIIVSPCIECIGCVGHRGYPEKNPENTILSLQSALLLGVDGLESDVRLTKDGEIIMMHDLDLDRTTNGTGLNVTLARTIFFDNVESYSFDYTVILQDNTGFTKQIKTKGRKLFVWIVDEEKDIEISMLFGADAILSNDPTKCIKRFCESENMDVDYDCFRDHSNALINLASSQNEGGSILDKYKPLKKFGTRESTHIVKDGRIEKKKERYRLYGVAGQSLHQTVSETLFKLRIQGGNDIKTSPHWSSIPGVNTSDRLRLASTLPVSKFEFNYKPNLERSERYGISIEKNAQEGKGRNENAMDIDDEYNEWIEWIKWFKWFTVKRYGPKEEISVCFLRSCITLLDRIEQERESEITRVKLLLNPDGEKLKPSTVIIEKFNIAIKVSDIMTLSCGAWLNDERFPPIYIVNTFFYPTLMNYNDGVDRVARWFLKPKKKAPPPNLFEKKFIFIPINASSHWTLAVSNFESKCFEMYDSLGSGFRTGFLTKLKEFFKHMAKKTNNDDDFEIWKINELRRKTPQQRNSDDCGVFAMITLEHLSRQAPLSFNQEMMTYFRERMIIEIKMGKLLESGDDSEE